MTDRDQSDPGDSSEDRPPAADPTPAGQPTEPDLAVGAVLDGEATPEEEARVLGDPALSARLDEIRDLRATLVADTAAPRLSDEARSRMLATALAVARTSDDDRPEPGRDDVAVVPSPLIRSRSSRRAGWVVGAVAAAIALVVVLAFVGFNRTSDGHSSESGADAAVSSASSGSKGSSTGTAGVAENTPPIPSTTTTTPTSGSAVLPSDGATSITLADIGTYPDVAALAITTHALAPSATPSVPLSAAVPCPGEIERAGLGGATTLGRALVGGQSVVVGRTATNDVAIVESTCAVLPLG